MPENGNSKAKLDTIIELLRQLLVKEQRRPARCLRTEDAGGLSRHFEGPVAHLTARGELHLLGFTPTTPTRRFCLIFVSSTL